jgi:tRNA threonylcarbamoyladenosine biosynthesis protein TsaE
MFSHEPYFSRSFELHSEADTQSFALRCAKAFAPAFSSGLTVYLEGDLGAGKTSFSRAFVQYFLPQQRVKSPTYTLVESYPTSLGVIYHFDLYRLAEPEELEYLAVRDLLTPPYVALVEWPSKAQGVLPEFDIKITIKVNGLKRFVEVSAKVHCQAVVNQIDEVKVS